MSDPVREISLEDAAAHLLEECRMVLPGIQALFGFQLIAVFNDGFTRRLAEREQVLHLTAILCVVLSIALVMAPAAIHRRREPFSVSRRFVDVSSSLLMWGMVPLAVATTLDVYVVALIVTHGTAASIAAGLVAMLAFIGLWWILPARLRLNHDHDR
jgi:hypothetical protein